MDSFALRIENAFFQGDVNAGFHRQAKLYVRVLGKASAVLLMEGIKVSLSRVDPTSSSLLKRRELTIELRDGFFDHLSMRRVMSLFELTDQSLAREQKPLAFSVALLL